MQPRPASWQRLSHTDEQGSNDFLSFAGCTAVTAEGHIYYLGGKRKGRYMACLGGPASLQARQATASSGWCRNLEELYAGFNQFTIATGTWHTLPRPPAALAYQAAVLVGNEVWCLGGAASELETLQPQLMVYNIQRKVWRVPQVRQAARGQGSTCSVLAHHAQGTGQQNVCACLCLMLALCAGSVPDFSQGTPPI